MALSLTKIRGFLAVAEHLNFRRAAGALDITQPALSAQIRALEELIGARLLTRTTRSVRLTADGERFVTRMRRLLEDMEAAVREIRDPRQLERGRVVFSAIPTVAAQVFPRVIERFKARYPGVAVEMNDEPTVVLERRIVAREVDFGIGGQPRWREALEFTPLVEDPIVLILRRDHPLARRRRVGIEQALRYPVIALAKGSNVRNVLDAHFERAGVPFQPVYSLVHHYTIGAMVEAGLGITFLPSMAAAMIERSRVLRAVPIDAAGFSRRVGLIKRSEEPLPPAAQAFYAFTVEALTRGRSRSGPRRAAPS
jgi:LysR family transcriptional regulator, carnitine catabolism transcriptional activator